MTAIPLLADALLEEAQQTADRAEAAAGVTIRNVLTPEETSRVSELLAAVWSVPNGSTPMESNLLRALAFSGSYVSAAYSESGEMLGASCAFRSEGADGAPEIHSHMTGLLPAAQGRGLGAALKLHQRAWALQRGITAVGWTYDPLIRRNAIFNLIRLGATATAYLPDFYGDMRDGLNAGNGSDRLLVHWDLTRPVGSGIELPAAQPLLTVDATGHPVRHDAPADGPISVAVPRDIGSLRRTDRQLALRWRSVARDLLSTAMDTGWELAGFDRTAGYVLLPH